MLIFVFLLFVYLGLSLLRLQIIGLSAIDSLKVKHYEAATNSKSG